MSDAANSRKLDKAVAAAREAERARCRKILMHPAAAECLDMAAQLAFRTDWSAAKCIATLKRVSAHRRKNYPASVSHTARANARSIERSRKSDGTAFVPVTLH